MHRLTRPPCLSRLVCGIAGVIGSTPGDSVTLLRQWSTDLAHRGPDGEGYLEWTGSGLPEVTRAPTGRGDLVRFVHRRLSIIDLTEHGLQPMSTDDGRFHLVYNGEIYNYIELRKDLDRLGYRFHSSSDSEVLLAAFTHWGIDALPRLIGMYAFAILDTVARTVTLARDPFGIKPLYLAQIPGGVAFSSEIPPLLRLSGVSRVVRPEPLYDYLQYGLTDHRRETLLSSVDHVQPAHYVTIAVDRPVATRQVRHWHCEPVTSPDGGYGELADAALSFRHHFEENVRLHLRSDVSVGTALSGGIDSSSIVATIRALGGRTLAMHTFSYVSGVPEIDEERWIDMAAASVGVTPVKVSLDAPSLIDALDDLVLTQGEPFGSTGIAAQRQVFQAAHDHNIKVMLDGQGSDELLGGYRAYLAARCSTLVGSWHFLRAVGLARAGTRLPGGESATRTFARATIPHLPQTAARLVGRLGSDRVMPEWINEGWFTDRSAHGWDALTDPSRRSLRSALMETTTRSNLPMLLRYEDRNSMSFSVESRVPFLTVPFVEWTLGLPEDYIIGDDGLSKRVLRMAMRTRVPDPILDRRDKLGYSTPEGAWLQALAPWVDRILGETTPGLVPPVDLPAARRQWKRIVSGHVPYDSRVWRWLNVIRWTQLFGVEYDS